MHRRRRRLPEVSAAASLVLVLCACDPPTEINDAGLTLRGAPVLGSASFPDGIASDPSIQRSGDGWVAAYTCLDPTGEHTAICMARSDDGVAWQVVPPLVDGAPLGTILVSRAPETALEGAFMLIDGNTLVIFASTYGAVADPAPGFPARLLRFEGTLDPLALAEPELVLAPAPGTGFCAAVYSPSLRRVADGLEMVFAGHCYDAEQPAGAVNGLSLLRATSSDGRDWTVVGPAVAFDPSAAALFSGGLAEPAGVAGRDDLLLVSAGFLEGQHQHTFLARENADGLFVPDNEPLLAPRETFDGCGAFAPDAHVDGDQVLIWYLALSCEGLFSIGLADGPVSVLD